METIHIDIAGRNYSLSVPSSEKIQVSAAATIVNDQVEKFRKQFEIEDPIDLLAMTSLQLASKAQVDKPSPATENAELNENQIQRIQYLNDRLTRVLEA
jgi:cell division protein ZapA